MFAPPCCPYRLCKFHLAPEPEFCVPHGSYEAKCRAHPIPRFRCLACRRTFSRQTFRADYRDHKPHLNGALFQLLASGVGIRQSARQLQLSPRCAELKFRKLARHMRRLNINVQRPLEGDVSFQFDEFESFETHRNARPLSIPFLIEKDSRFIPWAESATIRPRGKMTKKRLRTIERVEARYGVRRDTSRRGIQRTFARGLQLVGESAKLTLFTDEKSTYPGLAREAFGESALTHRTTNSKLARMTWNPLFPINHEEARVRDILGRVRRQSWLVSKKRRYLDLGLQMHMTHRNLVRTRFNRDRETPAELLGLVRRGLKVGEVLSWRQDWGRRSIHPLERGRSRAPRSWGEV